MRKKTDRRNTPRRVADIGKAMGNNTVAGIQIAAAMAQIQSLQRMLGEAEGRLKSALTWRMWTGFGIFLGLYSIALVWLVRWVREG